MRPSDGITAAPTLEELKVATRALDRALLWNHYVVPQFYNATFRLAYWNRFGKPERAPKYGHGFPQLWWIDAARDGELDTRVHADHYAEITVVVNAEADQPAG